MPAMPDLWLLWWLITEKEQRRGAFIAFIITVLMAIPLMLALLSSVDTADSIGRAAASDAGEIWQNVVNWSKCLVRTG